MSDEAAEREARARELREEIARLQQETGTGPAEGEEAQPLPGESLHDFAERRRREIQRQGDGGDTPA